MTHGREAIERWLPHAGAMVLLDEVVDWDRDHTTCRAVATAAGHPLARAGGVPAIAAVEYAAQATAVHGALLEPAPAPRLGMLALLRRVALPSTWLPPGVPVQVTVAAVSRGASGCLYDFHAQADDLRVAEGQLMVAFPTPGETR